MANAGWRVWLTRRDLPVPAAPQPFVPVLVAELDSWLDDAGIADGTPFLLSPLWEYDVVLNSYFRDTRMITAAQNTQHGYARDLAAFLTFLWTSRCQRSWRDATEENHLAYLAWRRRDPAGPRISGATWDREVAAVNQFYLWAVRNGHVVTNPVPQRQRRPSPAGAVGGRGHGATVPATYTHDAAGERVLWLPPKSYRLWRDIGVRGFGPDNLPDPHFRGRWAARNATFTDLMVRTGLRLNEQASLSLFEVPTQRGADGYRRFWLPAAVAKGGSARWVYVPASMTADLADYVDLDRRDVIAQAQAAGRYARIRRPLVVEDPGRPDQVLGRQHCRLKISQLDSVERQSLMVETEQGLAPAAFWLGEDGMPLAVSTWKGMFAAANTRCRRHAVQVRCHAHMLRHTFAVVTLEQLQRGHLAALAELSAQQRGHYTRVFGDPLDWVRRRLGHRSLTTTMIYLHALAELEMQTRMALVPDDWERPDDVHRTSDTDGEAPR